MRRTYGKGEEGLKRGERTANGMDQLDPLGRRWRRGTQKRWFDYREQLLGRHHFNPRRSKWFEMQEVQAIEKEKGGKKKMGKVRKCKSYKPYIGNSEKPARFSEGLVQFFCENNNNNKYWKFKNNNNNNNNNNKYYYK